MEVGRVGSEVGGQDQVDPKWPSHLPLTTSMGSMGGVYQGHQVYPTTLIYIRLVFFTGYQIRRFYLFFDEKKNKEFRKHEKIKS